MKALLRKIRGLLLVATFATSVVGTIFATINFNNQRVACVENLRGQNPTEDPASAWRVCSRNRPPGMFFLATLCIGIAVLASALCESVLLPIGFTALASVLMLIRPLRSHGADESLLETITSSAATIDLVVLGGLLMALMVEIAELIMAAIAHLTVREKQV